MSLHLFKFVNNLRIRWKMTVVVLPLVLVPIVVVGTVVGWIAYQQAYLGITQTSKDDLDHLAAFTVDLLDAHNQQFLTYQEDRKLATENELASLTNLAYNMVDRKSTRLNSSHSLLSRMPSSA